VGQVICCCEVESSDWQPFKPYIKSDAFKEKKHHGVASPPILTALELFSHLNTGDVTEVGANSLVQAFSAVAPH